MQHDLIECKLNTLPLSFSIYICVINHQTFLFKHRLSSVYITIIALTHLNNFSWTVFDWYVDFFILADSRATRKLFLVFDKREWEIEEHIWIGKNDLTVSHCQFQLSEARLRITNYKFFKLLKHAKAMR